MKKALLFFAFAILTLQGAAQDEQKNTYVEYVYSKHEDNSLKAYVFFPQEEEIKKTRSPIVIFHGGGWSIGEPSWAFGRAQHFAGLGMVALAAQYRLSDQKNITPLEAMADAREVIKWMRSHADSLRIDPNKIVAYGWSAGAHLAASAALSDELLSTPNALILVSPAVSLGKDSWFKKLLLNRTEVSSVSPDENVRNGLPPTLILQGRNDTVTPLPGVQNFANR